MTLDDLHQLDGLPFDLIVFARLDSPDTLPESIRADYRILDIDLAGDDALARSLRSQFADVCRAVLDHLSASGSRHPGLVSAGGMGDAIKPVYASWCEANNLAPLFVDVDDRDRGEDALRAAVEDGADGFFNVLADVEWLAAALSTGEPLTAGLPVVTLGPAPERGTGTATFSSLVPDGQRLGVQIADLAVAMTRATPPRSLTLDFLLDGESFPTA